MRDLDRKTTLKKKEATLGDEQDRQWVIRKRSKKSGILPGKGKEN